MEQVVGLVIVAGVGWVIWSMLTPPVQFVVTVKSGRVQVRGRLSAQPSAEIREFFADRFADVDRLKVSVHAPSSQTRSRIRITGNIAEDERQTIRNFLLTQI